MNPKDTNVNDKSPKFTCYELLRLSRGNGKKRISLFTRTNLFLSIKINFNPSRQITDHMNSLVSGRLAFIQMAFLLHFSFENKNDLFLRM